MHLFSKLFTAPKRAIQWFIHTSVIKKAIIVLIIGGLIWFGSTKIAGSQTNTPQYQTATVEKGDIIETVSVSGSVTANSQTTITSSTTGVVSEVYIKNGDQVTAGQNLFKVKSTATPKEQATAYAAYQSAVNTVNTAEQTKLSLKATLEKSRQAVLDAQNNVDNKNNNSEDYAQLEEDSIESTLTSARHMFTADEKKYLEQDGAIAAANANLTAASLAYQETQDSIITSPIDGTVANFSAKVGSSVTASSGNSNTTTTPSTVLVLGDFSILSVTATVNEVDIAKIKPGQKATITIDAFADKTFVGTVTSIDTIGTNNSGVVTYNVYIDFVSAPKDIYAGMTASAIIQTGKRDNVLSVPNGAIQTSTGEATVRLLRDGEITISTVETGLASDTNTEIISGISEGDTVVTSLSQTTGITGQQTSSPFSSFGGGGGSGGSVRIISR